MFPSRNNGGSTHNHRSSSSSSSDQQQQKTTASVHGFDNTSLLTSMQNLTLSDNNPESKVLNQNRLGNAAASASAAVAASLPDTLDYIPIQHQTRNSLRQPNSIRNNYYPVASTPQYYQNQILGNSCMRNPYSQSASISSGSSSSNSNGFNLVAPNRTQAPLFSGSQGFRDWRGSTNHRPRAYTPQSPVYNSQNLHRFYDIFSNPYVKMMELNMEHPKSLKYIFEDCTATGMDMLVIALVKSTDDLVEVAEHPSGTRALQELIKCGRKRPIIRYIPAVLADRVDELMMNSRARHVVQACFAYLNADQYMPLYYQLTQHWFRIAINKNGCLALNDCLNHLDYANKTCLLDLISQYTHYLAQDEFGNYVLQHVIRIKSHTERIVEEVLPTCDDLCEVKTGSFLVERCLETDLMPAVVERLIMSPKLGFLAAHAFGNYAIQKAIDMSKMKNIPLWDLLCYKLKQDSTRYESTPTGRKVAEKVKEWEQWRGRHQRPRRH